MFTEVSSHIRDLLAKRDFSLDDAFEAHDWLARTRNTAEYVLLLHDTDKHVARNAAWALTKASTTELNWFRPSLHTLIDLAIATSDFSLRRLVLNSICRMPLTKDDVRTDFLDFCLDQMARLSTPPGIQALCMKIAFQMCAFYPELLDELMRTVADLDLALYKPALRCTARAILSGKGFER